MGTSGQYPLIVFVIEFKSESFQFIFDIARKMNEKHLSFKENVAMCFACVGVVQCVFPFSLPSALAPTLQFATVCL